MEGFPDSKEIATLQFSRDMIVRGSCVLRRKKHKPSKRWRRSRKAFALIKRSENHASRQNQRLFKNMVAA